MRSSTEGPVRIRTEAPGDRDAVRSVNIAAFETPAEAGLVDVLRREARPLVSLVAEDEGSVVGHILFTPVTLSTDAQLPLMGLAPMAVVPARQRQGVGSALVTEGIERCRQLGAAAIVVLGHAEYYPRFGFVPSARFAITSEYDVPPEVFMIRVLRDGALDRRAGTIRYHAAFAGL